MQNLTLHRLFLLLLLCIALPFGVAAQRYPFFNLNVESGLIQSQSRDITQDKQGHLWIATLGGLSRYDGKTFRNYTIRDGLQSNTVNAVAADKHGILWVGGPNGLSSYDGRKFRHYNLASAGDNKTAVTRIKTGGGGSVWALASGKLFRVSHKKTQRYILPQQEVPVVTMLPEGDTAVWVAVQGGLLYHLTAKGTEQIAVVLPANGKLGLSTLYKDSKGKLWAGTNIGLYVLQGKRLIPAGAKGQKMDMLPPVLSITEDGSGNIWCGMNEGAFKLQDSAVTFFNKRNGLTDNAIPDVLTDAEENIWLASDGQGVYRYSGTQFTALDESTGLPSAQVMSMAADRGGKLFIGTYDAGLYTFDGNEVKPLGFPAPNTPAINAMRYVGNTLWLGTGGDGLWKYNGTYFFAVPLAKTKLVSGFITALYPDKSGRLWVGSANSLSYLKRDTFYATPVKGTTIEDILEIGKDSILIATANGLKLFHDSTVSDFKTGAVPDSATPQCLTMQGCALWIGTSDYGLIYYNLQDGKSMVLNKNSGLQSDFIYNVTTDNDGNVWAGTGYGIYRILYNGEGKPSITFYGKSQGIAGMESNHNSVLKMPDGSIWFGTINGAMHYRPQQKVIQAQPVSVMLQSVSVFGEPVTDSSWYAYRDVAYGVPYGLKLPYKKNNITFTFGAVSLSGTEAVRYRYKLTGLDAPWSDWNPANTITFSALPPGKYTLVVQCNTDGTDKAIQELKYPFTIITPFHKTGWFRLLILAGCILLGIGLQYVVNQRKLYRLRLIEKLRKEEQGKVRERTAEDFHDEVGNKLTRINVLTNVLKKKVELNPDAERIIQQIQDNTDQLYSGTRDILWSLKPSNDSLYEILHRIRDFGGELFGDTDVQFIFTGTDERWRAHKLPLDVSRNLIMIFKEALNNSLKYSEATEVVLDAKLRKDNALQLILTDNGKGFDLQYVKRGHGISNMQVRANRIGGRIYIDSRKGKGTIINLTFRVKKEKGVVV